MLLYHGTNLIIEKMDLKKCRPFKDFGTGFYVTELKEQAIKMANRVARIHGGTPIVNIYEIADDFMESEELAIRNFGKEVSGEWANFVMNNRNRKFKDIISYIVEDTGVQFDEAMNQFYSSETFDRLQDLETGLYLESSAYIYDMYQDEVREGKLVQKEI